MQITVEIPTQGEWFEMSEDVLPADGELCVIIHRYSDRFPKIVQFRKADWIYGKKNGDYFLCVDELFEASGEGVDVRNDSDLPTSFCPPSVVSHWKPLNLPEKIDRNIKEIIAYWFEEEEDK